MKTRTYHFSGTGHSRVVAPDLTERIGKSDAEGEAGRRRIAADDPIRPT
jgi:hypothetical protein